MLRVHLKPLRHPEQHSDIFPAFCHLLGLFPRQIRYYILLGVHMEVKRASMRQHITIKASIARSVSLLPFPRTQQLPELKASKPPAGSWNSLLWRLPCQCPARSLDSVTKLTSSADCPEVTNCSCRTLSCTETHARSLATT